MLQQKLFSQISTPSPFFNMHSVQLAVKTQLIYCTVGTKYENYMFRPILAIFSFIYLPNTPATIVTYKKVNEISSSTGWGKSSFPPFVNRKA